jgi:outer membrane autotransporter protein
MGAYTVEPYLRAQYLKLYQGTYTEQNGGDGVNLTVDSHSQQSLRGGGGVTVGRQFVLGYDSNLAAEARGNYSHEFMNTADSFTAFYTADGTPFTNSILMHGPNYYSAGFSVGHKDSFSSITLDYDGEATGKLTAHTASVNLRFRL